MHDFLNNNLLHFSITYYRKFQYCEKKGQYTPRVTAGWFVWKLANINKRQTKWNVPSCYSTNKSPQLICSNAVNIEQITINSDKMKVSLIVCTNTQWPWQITEPYAFDKLNLEIMVRFEKIKIPQLIKKFRAFYGTRRFIPAFTIAAKSSHPQQNPSGSRLQTGSN